MQENLQGPSLGDVAHSQIPEWAIVSSSRRQLCGHSLTTRWNGYRAANAHSEPPATTSSSAAAWMMAGSCGTRFHGKVQDRDGQGVGTGVFGHARRDVAFQFGLDRDGVLLLDVLGQMARNDLWPLAGGDIHAETARVAVVGRLVYGDEFANLLAGADELAREVEPQPQVLDGRVHPPLLGRVEAAREDGKHLGVPQRPGLGVEFVVVHVIGVPGGLGRKCDFGMPAKTVELPRRGEFGMR
ncbi:hypothetical protein B0T24DRAFT_632450 [Lasiosphaeria ovina]|uniref:Uncharacterized protein n=1 Tax=Lasiosphaeria ovina TaxID=92902 RepID=A0AAE0K484_9PEZI|nr:hypothetical protein B0T24DRAFT_632450 [Lasiosphaeria ovina]